MSRSPSANTDITAMRIFVDTEVTDFMDSELISIALEYGYDDWRIFRCIGSTVAESDG
ncbi:hypothetical protein [uncultured Paraburkholderia sp.]|uniref:hypothetical protein n=1 Tax=uncultured Paraburkholderia sp. TaxID=1822466 RepID=UPI002594DA92|nr:hypothetical protein [uncultured Paraburkholderia sp.]